MAGENDSGKKTRAARKEREGVVVSKSGEKTVVVLVMTRRRHPRYEKVIKQFRKYHVHDEKNESVVGDRVRIVEIRPMSRLKRWLMAEMIERGVGIPNNQAGEDGKK